MKFEEIKTSLFSLRLSEGLHLSEGMAMSQIPVQVLSTESFGPIAHIIELPNYSTGDFSEQEKSVLAARAQTPNHEYIPWESAHDAILLRLMSWS